MPFRKHYPHGVENTTDKKLCGYTDIQWEQVKALPANTAICACLPHREPTIPEQKIEVCDIKGPGSIVAHWLQIQADNPKTVDSQLICEGNQELYLDGSVTPQIEYLGTEDCYGYSWGMKGIQSDFYAAIIRIDHWKSGGLFAMLRAGEQTRSDFKLPAGGSLTTSRSSSPHFPRIWNTNGPKPSFTMPYRSAVYYYNTTP